MMISSWGCRPNLTMRLQTLLLNALTRLLGLSTKFNVERPSKKSWIEHQTTFGIKVYCFLSVSSRYYHVPAPPRWRLLVWSGPSARPLQTSSRRTCRSDWPTAISTWRLVTVRMTPMPGRFLMGRLPHSGLLIGTFCFHTGFLDSKRNWKKSINIHIYIYIFVYIVWWSFLAPWWISAMKTFHLKLAIYTQPPILISQLVGGSMNRWCDSRWCDHEKKCVYLSIGTMKVFHHSFQAHDFLNDPLAGASRFAHGQALLRERLDHTLLSWYLPILPILYVFVMLMSSWNNMKLSMNKSELIINIKINTQSCLITSQAGLFDRLWLYKCEAFAPGGRGVRFGLAWVIKIKLQFLTNLFQHYV